MNLVNSIDLLILEKVKCIDTEKVYVKGKPDKYGIGYKKTISIAEAYKIIKDDVDKITEDEEKAYSILKLLRNAATHSDFSYGEDSEQNIIFLLHYVVKFLENELSLNIERELRKADFYFIYEQIKDLDFGQILNERIRTAQIKSSIDFYNYISVPDGGDYAVMDTFCDNCGRQGISQNPDLGEIGVCVYCNHDHQIDEWETCEQCGKLFDLESEGSRYDDMLLCDGCDIDWDRDD
ncbi:hypothetical protein ACIP9C_16390 [Lysinibacillus sp. NPDC093210]|uniref:hypothetical protein n=1 Tax=Lysinibacillus sp. NPDC093210 TaxID=3364133 RepID=UPI0037F9E845